MADDRRLRLVQAMTGRRGAGYDPFGPYEQYPSDVRAGIESMYPDPPPPNPFETMLTTDDDALSRPWLERWMTEEQESELRRRLDESGITFDPGFSGDLSGSHPMAPVVRDYFNQLPPQQYPAPRVPRRVLGKPMS